MVDKGVEIYIPVQVSYKSNQKKESKESSSETIPGKKTKNLSSLDFSDEDFIVFCLREDGAIHRKSEKPVDDGDCTNVISARPISRKLMYENNEDKPPQSNHDQKSSLQEIRNCTTNGGEYMTCNKKVKVKPRACVYKGKRTKTKTEKQEEVSVPESCNSKHSDGSSGSFAFPVLSWEGVESPAQMPKPETLHFWKHKKWGVLCLCKRF